MLRVKEQKSTMRIGENGQAASATLTVSKDNQIRLNHLPTRKRYARHALINPLNPRIQPHLYACLDRSLVQMPLVIRPSHTPVRVVPLFLLAGRCGRYHTPVCPAMKHKLGRVHRVWHHPVEDAEVFEHEGCIGWDVYAYPNGGEGVWRFEDCDSVSLLGEADGAAKACYAGPNYEDREGHGCGGERVWFVVSAFVGCQVLVLLLLSCFCCCGILSTVTRKDVFFYIPV